MKAKVAGAQLGQPALQAQSVQPEPQIVAGGEQEAQLLGRAHQQQLELALRVLGAQLVQIVDHQPHRARERLQILKQPLDDRPAVEIGRGGELPHRS